MKITLMNWTSLITILKLMFTVKLNSVNKENLRRQKELKRFKNTNVQFNHDGSLLSLKENELKIHDIESKGLVVAKEEENFAVKINENINTLLNDLN